MQREIMIRKPGLNGTNHLVRATVISEHDGKLRCTNTMGIKKPFTVEAKDVVEASTVFAGNRLAQRRGIVPIKGLPDNRSSLAVSLNAGNGHVAPPKKTAKVMKPSKLIHEKGVILGDEPDNNIHDGAKGQEPNESMPAANFHVGQTVRHKKSGWVGKVSSIHPTKSPNHKLVRVQYQSEGDTQPMLVNHHSSELEACDGMEQ